MKHKLIRAACLFLALALLASQAQAADKLKKGSKGAEVLQLQSALKSLGYSITVDGSYGNGTMNTVKTFQKQHGLKADGVAGVQTLGLLYALAPSGGTQAASAAEQAQQSSAASAADGTNATVRTANGGSLKFRAKASTASNVVVHCYLPNGTRVEILSRGKTWCKARYNGKTGYLMTEYLAFDSAAPAAATAAPAAPAPPASAPSGSSAAYVKTGNGGSLNLRSAAKTGNNIIAAIPNGAALTVITPGGTWSQVVYAGAVGFVMTKYLVTGSAAAAAPAPAPSPTPTPTPAPLPASSGVSLTGYVNTSNGGSLNLRKTPSDRAGVLAAIPNGAALTVTGKGETWCAVVYNGIAGYAMTKFLYIPLNGGASSSAGTHSSAPAASSGAAYAYTRTLRSGDTGEDVRWVQARLKELGYAAPVNSAYDSATIAAVKAFQKKNGITADGLAGKQTFTLLNSSQARKATDADISYSSLSIDSTGSAVTAMQNALIKLGYPLKATGEFDVNTHNAVVAFQVRNGLTISGIADGLTRTVLMSGTALPYSTPVSELPAGTGLMAAPAAGEIKLMHWQNEIKGKVKAGETFLIFDPQTSLSWNLVFYSLGRHADSQPASWRDTQIMNRSFGGTSWTIHPVYVKLPTGEWTIATMHNRPHLTGSILDNGFGGHLCVHFLRDMSEAQRNDPDYGVQNQVTLRNAWKALTGETINY